MTTRPATSAAASLKWGSMVVEFSNFEGSTFDGCSAHLRAKGSTFENGGVWRCFAKAVEKRGIDVRFENPAVSLVQDPFTKEVSGVIARRADGTEYSIKSAKGVLLACGGYENNLTMQRDFHGMETVYTAGTPGNTGDGIKMLMEAGAQIWHMKNQTQSGGFWLGIKVPEYDSTFMRNFTMAGNSWIEIDSESKRFYDEAGSYHRQHMKYMEYGRYVDLPHERALPVSLIFDEKTREAGSIGSQWLSWPTTTEGYTWSNDNLAEIERAGSSRLTPSKNWLRRSTVTRPSCRPPSTLWNAACDAGVDAEFGRDPEKMAKIDTAPYYAVSITPDPRCHHRRREARHGRPRSQLERRADRGPLRGWRAGQLRGEPLPERRVPLRAMLSGRTAAQTAFGAVSEFEAVVKGEATARLGRMLLTACTPRPWTACTTRSRSPSLLRAASSRTSRSPAAVRTCSSPTSSLPEYVGAIIANQSADVDIVSGATVDCQAIGTAIGQAFAK